MKTHESSIRKMMDTRGISEAKIAEFGGKFEGGFFICDSVEFKRMLYENCKEKKILGLGDAFAMVANPIANAVDATFKTNLAGCDGCVERQVRWNGVITNLR